MLFLIPFTVCAFLALIVDTANGGITTFLPISRSCSVDDVCLTLETLSRSQFRLEKTMKYGTDDGSKFSLTAVVQCTSLVESPPPNQHYKMAALDLQGGIICRALGQAIDASQAYSVSAEILNQAGWKGVNSGHPGLLFNVVDENNTAQKGTYSRPTLPEYGYAHVE